MTIVEQLSVGRVWQREERKNGDLLLMSKRDRSRILFPLRTTYTARPSQNFLQRVEKRCKKNSSIEHPISNNNINLYKYYQLLQQVI
uniref:Ovule protein n=1 Tax=Heterorhabditis bacteriophora TaxID=37862 RepID=A0A1I7WYU2_HETBA